MKGKMNMAIRLVSEYLLDSLMNPVWRHYFDLNNSQQ